MLKSLIRNGVLTGLILLAGCAKDIQVQYAAEYQSLTPPPPAIEVYVVGVDDANLTKFQQMSVDEFFQPGTPSALRKYADDNNVGRSLTFSVDHPIAKVIAKDDPIWQTWKTCTHLVIVQNYPHEVTGNPIAQRDARYLELPLDSGRWNGQTLVIGIGSNGPRCESGIH